MMPSLSRFLVTLAIALAGCSGPVAVPSNATAQAAIDSTRLLEHLRFLASPALEGRATGTPGNEAARAYIERTMQEAGLSAFPAGWRHSFTVPNSAAGPATEAANVVGFVRGTEHPDRAIVVTAHFDHLGVRGGDIYHGADDNASGSAALLEIGRYFAANPPRNTILFAALDAEEMGLRGARAFVADPPIARTAIALNVNMDMVSRNAAGELYAVGTRHYPALTPLVESVAERSPLRLLRGHDGGGSHGDDWTALSDHAAFHEVGIPFVYFGVEDHPDYHRPTDTFENIEPAFFLDAARTVLDFIREADRRLDEVTALRPR